MNMNIAEKQDMPEDKSSGSALSGWRKVVALEEVPVLGSRVIKTGSVTIAVFRTTSDEIFAVKDECPHKKGPLSQGIVHGTSVTCPLHNWKIDLASGEALGPDEGCTNTYPAKVEDGMVFIDFK